MLQRAPHANRTFRRAVGTLCLLCAASLPAAGEILVLKDGKRIPCRVLKKNEMQITIRLVSGSEVTYPMEAVERIDEKVSPAEVYEGAAEAVRPDTCALAYYVGLWGLDVGKDRASDSEKAFAIARREATWAGRAFHQLARCSDALRMKKRFAQLALRADPTLVRQLGPAEASDAGATGGAGGEELNKVIEFVDALVAGRHRAALARLKSLERSSDEARRDRVLARLYEITGLDAATLRAKCMYATKGRPTASRTSSKDGTCSACGGGGYMRCSTCSGQGFAPCTACKGQGGRRVRIHNSHRGTRYEQQTCKVCRGTGLRACPVCVRRKGGPLATDRTVNNRVTCTQCDGFGKVTQTRTSSTRYPYGSGRHTTTSERSCPGCSGRGYMARTSRVSLSTNATGVRRCQRCNANGHIPLSGYGVGAPTSRHAFNTDENAAPSAVFGDVTLRRLQGFLDLARAAAMGKAGYRWGIGSVVQIGDVALPEPPKEVMTFACGEWQTPKSAEYARKRQKALSYTPRKADVSQFLAWANKQELAHLSAHAQPVGTGAKPADEVLGLVDLWQRNSVSRRAPLFDRLQVFATTFRPATRMGGDQICRYSLSKPAGSSPSFELVMLRRSKDWPALEVCMRELAGSDVRLGAVAAALSSDGRLRGQPLTVYYRVKTCTRTVKGSEENARIRLAVEVEPCAVVVGSAQRPLRSWTEPVEEYRKSASAR
jgi:hypothetical protein